jgi:hypothetical protein
LRHDWGEARQVPALQGRWEELALLAGWVREASCRVVQVLGAGGIGKTTLAVRLARELAPEFPVLSWRSLRNAPAAEEWLAGVIGSLSASRALPPESLEARLDLALALLREQRVLLVLDNLETILEPGAATVRYRAGYEGYGEALRRLGESAHQGCLLLTSREQPLRADEVAARALHLAGLQVGDGNAGAWWGRWSRATAAIRWPCRWWGRPSRRCSVGASRASWRRRRRCSATSRPCSTSRSRASRSWSGLPGSGWPSSGSRWGLPS